ncbi:MAG: hypothetical protein A2504_05870 [Bdellovibrionales bacterium RIFOXYD12_FULL_39_22]|nr:MAG: hypothetical protein A2385_05955 [Bdellovibrionales bacterium RIFOXYB1_FULL_39_21]OFZ41823.1 MAG: hypothetical protein A2485_07925 [Bdellovibrionales bacterium RIFOXYC12_FULL_39_17]OFZ50539.1 MAG: hypothetical protein A2404_04875 [Bdellovibrionales bacterium RIFOXYC1_FULL_39_130]OFZ77762.1 MAG: hypothetical protein A2560_00045 [Bdellovibrionales bacterium RIFOXYD1_FULL_39_84]OFZ93802.1 MAG: hypothetical protein A2504_05870 [Bdellovibrionales bacterium RIFOXYD12_FULL_39_22]HLE11512.1 hy
MNKLLLAFLLFPVLLIAAEISSSADKTIKVRSPASTRESLAQKYMDLADELAEANIAGKGCELDASVIDVFDLYRKAKVKDSAVVTGSNVRILLWKNAGFKLLEKNIVPFGTTAFPKEKGSPDFLVNTVFFARGSGAMGPFEYLYLNEKGALISKRPTYDEDSGHFGYEETAGTWSYVPEGEISNGRERTPTLVITIGKGKEKKTKAFRLHSFGNEIELFRAQNIDPQTRWVKDRSLYEYSTFESECDV